MAQGGGKIATGDRMADKRKQRLAEFIEPFVVKPGSKVVLGRDFDPAFKGGVEKKKEGTALLEEGVRLLCEYQARLAAQDAWSVLVVLQALDAAGKDGTIRHVMTGVNPQGVSVHSFKVPSAEELDHDFLWRYARRLPTRGEIGIFNRSYYEEVLIVRVHPEILHGENLPDELLDGDTIWKRRYRSIVDLERHLHRNGTRVIKFFLHISKDEQRKRFLKRIDEPDKNWKFGTADVEERKLWKDYMRAYEDCLSATSTDFAPWYAVPADDKRNTRLIVSEVVLSTLRDLKMSYPKPSPEHRRELKSIRKMLAK
jgi:PPK2 family polyphosphate:nucleotide phosphotransferase